MKQLLSGNEAVARGLYEAGCRFVSSYPGTPATEIAESAAEYAEVYAEWAPNEKTALEAAIGASLGGARSLCCMKQVGLNVCADPLFSASYIGVNGGLVIAVADDPGMHSSQNEEDTRHYAIAAKIPMLEPSDAEECRTFTGAAFELSERYDTPVLLRTCTRIAHSRSMTDTESREELPLRPYEPDPRKRVVVPANAQGMHIRVEERCRALEQYCETTELNRTEYGKTEVGFVTSGTCYQYVRECFPAASVFKLGMVNPLPTGALKAFAAQVEKLYVIEEEDAIIEQQMRAAGIRVDGGKDLTGYLGELSTNRLREAFGIPVPEAVTAPVAVPARPPVMCPGCPHRGAFVALNRLGVTVHGDIGCYTLGYAAPLSATDTAICMGSSIGITHGFTKVCPEAAESTVAVIGDSTFMHSGIPSLTNMVYNRSRATVLILDNAITGMTGHQQNPTTGLTLKQEPTYAIRMEDICRALGIRRVFIADPEDPDALEARLREELAAEEVSVVIARRPCVLIKGVQKRAPMRVDALKCVGCGTCASVGCPALRVAEQAEIDPAMCAGCELCARMCPAGAIGREADT